jgi:hypothetical protein
MLKEEIHQMKGKTIKTVGGLQEIGAGRRGNITFKKEEAEQARKHWQVNYLLNFCRKN